MYSIVTINTLKIAIFLCTNSINTPVLWPVLWFVLWPVLFCVFVASFTSCKNVDFQMVTDAAFGYPWDRQLKMNSERNPNTYAYVQSYLSPNSTTFIPAWMG